LAFRAWEGEKGISCVSNSKAGILLCKNSLKGKVSNPNSQLVFLDNPRFVFVRFVNMMRNQGAPDRGVYYDRRELHNRGQRGHRRKGHTKESLTDTFKGTGIKLDALVHVAHNVRLGTNCRLAAGTIIGRAPRLATHA
jgi:UDP-3-O-[3-hydroxymyristoyl] glucosamine N-acyltransferase